jgi:hypothetical protein
MAESHSDGDTVGQTLAGLAKALATRATLLHQKFVERYARETPQEPLHALVNNLRAKLLHDMEVAEIADQVAQAITCGLATVRATLSPDGPFTPGEAIKHLPPTHSFVQYFFSQLLQGLAPGNHRASECIPASIVEDLGVPQLFQLLSAPWVGALFHASSRTPQTPGYLDPATHLYEGFLQAYNAEKRSQRGVFYTPDAAVAFIVRSVDAILRRDCGCADGILSPETSQILDPAAGTGTFLNQIVRTLRRSFEETQGDRPPAARDLAWKEYIHPQSLPRVTGCEVLLAPFVVAHVLLGQTLAQTGFHFDQGQRLGVYLANALEVAIPSPSTHLPQGTLDAHLRRDPAGSTPAPHEMDEARSAMQQSRFHVIIGNPPYSRKSQTASLATMNLIAPYKEAVRSERNIQALSDDYLKFLRLAQVLVERAGWGVVGFVLNNRFLTGGIYRGVRESLCTTFDLLYVLNLHGGKKGYEQVPAGVLDENIFPIAQGICICLLVKRPGPPKPHAPQVLYHDLLGSCESKLAFLSRADLHSVPWVALPPAPPGNPFAPDPVSPALRAEWETYAPLDQLFSFYNVGGKPGDDDLLVSVRRDAVIPKLEAFLQDSRGSQEGSGKRVTEAQQKILQQGGALALDAARVEPYLYRPFDLRWVYYDPALWTRGVPTLKAQCRGTLLLLCAKIVNDPTWAHVLVTTTFPDVIALSNCTSVNCYVFPACISTKLEEAGTPAWNLVPAFQTYLTTMGVDLARAGETDVLAYLYALLSSPTYRSRYDLLLRGGAFPRVPLVRDQALFAGLSILGRRLLALHANLGTPQAQGLSAPDIRADIPPGTRIAPGFPRFEDNQVLISPTTKFAPVPPEVWQFVVGKYPVCRQWLAARVNEPLSPGDITQFLHLLGVIRDTIAIMRDIDACITAAGHFPLPSAPLTQFH